MPQTTAGLDASLAILDAVVYLGVHTGAPGANGETNELAGARPAVTFGAAEAGAGSARRRRNSAEVLFTNPGADTYQAYSVWTAATGGTCYWVIAFDTNRTLIEGDDLRLPVNGLECGIAPSA